MIKFNSRLDDIRHNIHDMFFPYLDKKDDEIDYEELFGKIEMISTNEKYYKYFVTILFLDDYKLKFRYLINNQATENDKAVLKYYDENIRDIDDIVEYIETEGNILDMINSTLVFTNLKSSYQRDVLTSCKLKNDYLKSVSPLHILDLFYYSFPVSLDNYIELFNEYNDEENSLDASGEATVEFSKMLLDLYVSDTDNYKNIIDELVETYKIMEFHRVFQDDELDKFVKNNDLDIYNKFYSDSHIRIKLLDYFLEYNINCSKEEQDVFKEEYNKKVKKM